MLKTDDFDYDLPEELIASRPLESRTDSRMMVVNRAEGTIEHCQFKDFPRFHSPEDLLVLNNTQVLPSRFFSDDGRIEVVRLDFDDPVKWTCLVRPGRKMRIDKEVLIGGVRGRVVEILPKGERRIEFDQPVDVDACGQLALPHYMERESDSSDMERYQTVFAAEPGAIAAPTAGLHFDEQLLDTLNHVFITLHVGIGTFQPVRVEDVSNHEMHSESYRVDAEAVEKINNAISVTAVGTTVTRVLEHCFQEHQRMTAHQNETSIFIYPPHTFRRVDRLLTNFHLPKSTLMMLISAFAGKELIFEAYAQAVKERYRFYSYGDCMLIL